MNPKFYTGLQACQAKSVHELPRWERNELHFVVLDNQELPAIFHWARSENYYLCSMIASDERLLEDNKFKLYYVLSAPEGDELVILENILSDPQHPDEYYSISSEYPQAHALESEIFDLFGLSPYNRSLHQPYGFLLHTPFPAGLSPLRKTRPIISLQNALEEYKAALPDLSREPAQPEGMQIIPVGPIHAGIIEPGYFPFHVAGEVVEELPVRLGYTHRGIEKMFETSKSILEGCELAERVSGDSSFAHSMAYCLAVESLAEARIPPAAQYWRAICLELERIYNHIGDTGAIVHDIAYDRAANHFGLLREAILQLNQRVSGHRLLRGVNTPGGVKLNRHLPLEELRKIVGQVVYHYLVLCKRLIENPSARDRFTTIGVLSGEEAFQATGLPRRAAGDYRHDFRLLHPTGAYCLPEVQEALQETITQDNSNSTTQRILPIFPYHLTGDVFARVAMRAAEVETSLQIINRLVDRLLLRPEILEQTLVDVHDALHSTTNYEFGLGFTEGWRGDIFYWVMKGPNSSVFRLKIRDTSLYNWQVFEKTVCRKPLRLTGREDKPTAYLENFLADFPLINKSFNLSYAGHDL